MATFAEVISQQRRIGEKITWPEGKRFAFTVVDDTDYATVRNTRPIYDLLLANGIRTTKTVWPLAADAGSITKGDSLECVEYRDWILELKRAGVEIAYHGAADGSSTRPRIEKALKFIQQVTGEPPSLYTNHLGQKEALYWGSARFDPPVRWLYRFMRQQHGSGAYSGADETSSYFWGDLLQAGPKYVRNLVFNDINTLKMDPLMPYHDVRRPFVQSWFSSSYGSGADDFCRLLSEENQDRLLREGGACIVYTHFGSNFYPIREDFKRLMERLSTLPGWFVPATTLLDHIAAQRGAVACVQDHTLRFQWMQWNWLLGQAVRRFR